MAITKEKVVMKEVSKAHFLNQYQEMVDDAKLILIEKQRGIDVTPVWNRPLLSWKRKYNR